MEYLKKPSDNPDDYFATYELHITKDGREFALATFLGPQARRKARVTGARLKRRGRCTSYRTVRHEPNIPGGWIGVDYLHDWFRTLRILGALKAPDLRWKNGGPINPSGS